MHSREKPKRASFGAVLACAWPALVLATVCLLPYLNKPFLIDDPHFLAMAKQVTQHPLHPMDFTICWNTYYDDCQKAYALTPGNALMGYALVPTVLTGTHEWVAHLTQLLFVWVSALAMASLVLRLGWSRWHAAIGALLLVSIPPFLPMASTAMPDILATALAVVAIERLAAWKAESKWSQGVATAVALGLAGFARSHLALLLPLAALYLLGSLNPREVIAQIGRQYWLWAPVLGGICISWAINIVLGEQHVAPPPIVMGWWHIPHNLFSFILYFGFPIPLAACWIANRWKERRPLNVLALAVLAIVPYVFRWDEPLAWTMAIAGFGALAHQIAEVLKKRLPIDLVLLLWVLIPLPIVYYSHLPMKYLLPCMPAAILLCFRWMEGFSSTAFRFAAIATVVCSTFYSVLVLRSDAEFARFGRDSLNQLIRPSVAAGQTVWYPGQYWSYWYAPLAGGKLTSIGGPQPNPGDLLVVDVYAAGTTSPLARFPNRTLVQTVRHTYSFGRTMGAGIGLYSNGPRYWMWGFGQSDLDRYELWRIDAK